MHVKSLLFVFISLLLIVPCTGDIIIVDANGTGDYPTIQAAIDNPSTVTGDTIELQPGTYTGYGNRDIDFGGKAITVRSIDPNDPNVVATTVIDCESPPPPIVSYFNGFCFENGEDANSVIDGLTIVNGSTLAHGIICGGIVCINGSSPTIVNCVISYNWGSGISCFSSSNPAITNCIVSHNHYGSGIYLSGSSPSISHCIISSNRVYADNGGGIYNWGGSPTISNCVIELNSAKGVSFPLEEAEGGGIYSYSGRPIITNCIIRRNSADNASISYVSMSNNIPTINNCTIINNKGGGLSVVSPQPAQVTNCIIWGNSDFQIDGLVEATYSNIKGGLAGEGNIDVEPLVTWDGHLQAGSPCIDAGDPCFSPVPGEKDMDDEERIMGGRIDIGCDEFLDTDSDGLSDFWEQEYFGSPTAADYAADVDWDGWTNLDEYANSTEPNVIPVNYYVDPLDGDDEYDGLAEQWDGQHGPKQTIQAAINECGDKQNDSVILTEGTYEGEGNRDLYFYGNRFYGKAITVRSTNPGDPCTVAATIIDCQATESSPHRGFRLDFFEGPASVIAGLTITNGYANDDGPMGYYMGKNGGAIFCYVSCPTITNCVITNNTAHESGGGIGCEYANPTITDCIITDNTARLSGGGIYCEYADPTINGCIVNRNLAEFSSGGGIGCYEYSNPTIINCSVNENRAVVGGGIRCHNYSSPTITNCVISGNTAEAVSFAAGGGIYCYDYSSPTITNCIISGNTADLGGGILYANSNSTTTNCTIIGNSAHDKGGGTYYFKSTCAITNCNLRDNKASNGPEIYLVSDCNVWVNYSNIQGGENDVYVGSSDVLIWGLGNIDEDPCFVDAGYWDANGTPSDANDDFWADGDYHLKSEGWRWDISRQVWTWDDVTSRCIDAGNPGSLLGDELLTIPSDPDNQWGENLRINMGAYGGTAEASMGPYDWALLADLTNDGKVDFADLGEQTQDWINSADEQPGDLNQDGIVDMSDFALLGLDWLKQTTWHEP